jgi:hypothetical protein
MNEYRTVKPLFDDGPFPLLRRVTGVFRSGAQDVGRRAVFAVLIAWAPLAILVALQGVVQHNHALQSFLLDFGTHARFLIAAPLLIIAEAVCLPALELIARHFLETGIVVESNRERYHDIIDSTVWLLRSPWIEGTAIALAFVTVAVLRLFTSPELIHQWYAPEGRIFSLAG